jgi:hypothetical protein
VQRPVLVEGLDLTAPVAEVTVDAQHLLQGPGRARIIPGQPPRDPQVVEGVSLAGPVAEMLCGGQGSRMAGEGFGPRAVVA